MPARKKEHPVPFVNGSHHLHRRDNARYMAAFWNPVPMLTALHVSCSHEVVLIVPEPFPNSRLQQQLVLPTQLVEG
jgi:hypothetical protein